VEVLPMDTLGFLQVVALHCRLSAELLLAGPRAPGRAGYGGTTAALGEAGSAEFAMISCLERRERLAACVTWSAA